MRKSSMLIMIILMVVFGGFLLAADVLVLGPAKKDLAVAKELQGILGERGRDWIVRDSRIRLRTMKATGEERLATDGSWGVVAQVEPKLTTLTEKSRAQYMAVMIADTIREKGQTDRGIAWVELIYSVGEQKYWFRTLLRRDDQDEQWLAADPAIPPFWEPEDIPEFTPAPTPEKGE